MYNYTHSSITFYCAQIEFSHVIKWVCSQLTYAKNAPHFSHLIVNCLR